MYQKGCSVGFFAYWQPQVSLNPGTLLILPTGSKSSRPYRRRSNLELAIAVPLGREEVAWFIKKGCTRVPRSKYGWRKDTERIQSLM